MNEAARARTAVAALAAVLATTASWWALALWPVTTPPDWLLRTREVCFGATPDTLPNAGGWLLLIGQPVGMIAILAVVWGSELRAALAAMLRRADGQVAVGMVGALVLAGTAAAVVRVRTAGVEPFSAGSFDVASRLTRINDRPPAFSLVDQGGSRISLDAFRGRPVLVTFAFAHCETVCPLIVKDVLAAQRQLAENRPAVLVITLDPWRDTPARLPAIASAWLLDRDAYVLSGAPPEVERALDAWRVPRTRNQKTGDILHPSIVYVVGADGRITYTLGGSVDAIVAAVHAL